MHSSRLKTACWCGAILVLLSTSMSAVGAGFVSSTRVSRVGDIAVVSISFNCNVNYLGHDPVQRGDQLRIQLEANSICSGVAPQAAATRELHRPMAADDASLVDVEYDGTAPLGAILRLRFSDEVGFTVEPFGNANTVMIQVFLNDSNLQITPAVTDNRTSRRIQSDAGPAPRFVINLQSANRPPAAADLPDVDISGDKQLFVSEARIDGVTWYRVRLGYFPSAELAARELARLRGDFPGAWIDRVSGDTDTASPVVAALAPSRGSSPTTTVEPPPKNAEHESLMADARRAMIGGELSKAVQIYTKILRAPAGQYHPQAQEFLALARERNGQIAHAKAEYQRYLATYPDSDGAPRVRQRLASLVSQGEARPVRTTSTTASNRAGQQAIDPWTIRSFFTQYYRRDVNQINDNDEVVSQSAIYSDANIDVRRRGERYDFSARINGGYRYDLLSETQGSGNDFRLSYAYADLADSRLGLRGRLGRQSKNTGGVLGRFDGLNLSYDISDRVRVDAVAGKPVTSVSDGIDSGRTFYGASSNFSALIDSLDVGVFFIQQSIDGMTDRQAVGGEMRYFGENTSFWALADYDTSFDELGSLFVQGSWRLPSQMTLTGVIDRRRSPFLTASSALIGQQVADFSELRSLFTEDEIRQLALDRAASSTTLTMGLSRPLTPKLQLNINGSETRIDATPDSGGVSATVASTYRYVSTDLVASSLLKEGDVSIIGVRYADSSTNETYSVNLDSRFPLGRAFRINPRLRVDYREIKSDQSTQLTYTPGIRFQYRKDRRFRMDFEAGMQFSSREMTTINQDRESWFVNLGYQLFFQ